jgi:pilus assembly protein FimV
MKRPLQLPLAIALALSGTDALALGLGTIHVNSKLNQPLDAEIPVLQGTQGEAEGLLVQLAAAEDFDRVGLNRSRLSVPLEFSVIKGSRGDLLIKVTSKEVIREPFLDFLVEANWPKGRLLREYTVLLDPPVMAPATGTAAVATAAKTPERAATQPLPEAKPKAPAKPAKAPPVAAAPRAEPAPSKPAPAAAEPKRTAANGEYAVEAGDTLSGIARDVRPDEATNINQLMLALLKQNPNAFFKDNINSLKRGSILRIPSADQVKSVASASEAAATVHQQIEDWRGGAAAKPTLVADTGTPTPPPPKAPAAKTTSTPTSTASKTPSERLELVPPKAGKDTVAMADRPGSGAGSAASTELKSELARTKEALTSREQEAGELKSRVKELEDTKSKTDRLITLKDSEIADLQRKLKDLQSGAKTTATTPPATSTTPTTTPTTPATTTATPATGAAAKGDAAKVSKEDIWGTASTTPDTKSTTSTPPSSTATTASTTSPESTTGSASTTTPSAGTSTTPSTVATTTAGGTTPSATGTTTPATGAATTATGTTPSTTTSSSMTPSTSSATTPSSSTSDSTTPASTTPSATGESSSTSASTTTPMKPAATTAPIKPTAASKTQPLAPTGSAWYEQSWVKPAAIGAGALLLLAGLLGMRKRRVPAVERGSIAGAFGDTPLRSNGGAVSVDAEEESLRDQLMQDPSNLGLHLELLSLLYSERNIDAFEDAAHVMHAQVIDPHQPEWLEARAMGQELAPHNALFFDAAPADDVFDDEAVTAPHAIQAFDHDDVFKPREPLVEPARATTSAFDFDLDAPAPAAPLAPPPASEAAFAFESLPPIDFGAEAHRELESTIAPAPLPVEEEFPGDDGVGTKLDLAKAYLDMGDPEGARSMLEEVLAEGNDTQKGEARKLMAEIR